MKLSDFARALERQEGHEEFTISHKFCETRYTVGDNYGSYVNSRGKCVGFDTSAFGEDGPATHTNSSDARELGHRLEFVDVRQKVKFTFSVVHILPRHTFKVRLKTKILNSNNKRMLYTLRIFEVNDEMIRTRTYSSLLYCHRQYNVRR